MIRERNRLDAELTRVVRVADARQACEHDGLKTMASWLRNHTRLSAAAAAELVRSGRALEHLPVLAAAFAAGDVTAGQVAAVAPVARAERLAAAAAQGVDLAEIDAALDVADPVDPATGPGTGEMGLGAVIAAARARWLACDGQVTRSVLGPDGMPLDHGRSLRLVPPRLRRAAEVRDGGCVFTGCGAPTHWCDVRHLLAWIDGGGTSLDNSALLCERHHTKVHHGFRVERRPDGRWRTRRPDGTEIRTGPDSKLPPDRAPLTAPLPRAVRSTWNARQACMPRCGGRRRGRPLESAPVILALIWTQLSHITHAGDERQELASTG